MTLVLEVIRTILTLPFPRKIGIRTPTFEITILISEHLHLETGSPNV